MVLDTEVYSNTGGQMSKMGEWADQWRSEGFTPAMVKAVFDELKNPQPQNHFTIGIRDDVTHTNFSCPSR